MDNHDLAASNKAVLQALGDGFQHCRDRNQWSRNEMSVRTPTRLGNRTILAYEHGLREVSVTRLIELSRTLGVSPMDLLAYALQHARVALEDGPLWIDMLRMTDAAENHPTYACLLPWARNRMSDADESILELHPIATREVAAAFGLDHGQLVQWLAEFIPLLEEGTKENKRRQSKVNDRGPRKRGSRNEHRTWTDDDAQQWATEYESGKSIRALADANNLAYGTMYAALMSAGVTVRRRGSNTNARRHQAASADQPYAER